MATETVKITTMIGSPVYLCFVACSRKCGCIFVHVVDFFKLLFGAKTVWFSACACWIELTLAATEMLAANENVLFMASDVTLPALAGLVV